MRDPNRIPQILEEIKKIWEKYPDMRLGQLIGNVFRDPTLYYVEDQGLVDGLKDLYEEKHIPVNYDIDALVFDIIKKHPEELFFVLQSTDYKSYAENYAQTGTREGEELLNQAEFLAVKDYFSKNNV